LKINELPLKFTGFLSILRDGYNININAASEKTTIRDMISVLPRNIWIGQKTQKLKETAICFSV
jgi:AsmA protein